MNTDYKAFKTKLNTLNKADIKDILDTLKAAQSVRQIQAGLDGIVALSGSPEYTHTQKLISVCEELLNN